MLSYPSIRWAEYSFCLSGINHVGQTKTNDLIPGQRINHFSFNLIDIKTYVVNLFDTNTGSRDHHVELLDGLASEYSQNNLSEYQRAVRVLYRKRNLSLRIKYFSVPHTYSEAK